MFKKPEPEPVNLLNEAHSLGASALQAFEDLATDLETAAGLASDHEANSENEATRLRTEAAAANAAATRYATSASKIRELVS
jgi:hypothetical protein